jgi:hypothetical protein
MGGNIWKNPPTVRLEKVGYEVLTNKILSVLGKKFGEEKFFLLPSFRSKEDFGDADILVKNEGYVNFSQFVEFVKESFGLTKDDVSRNGHFISVRIENFQVDFIFHLPENWETAKNYYRYSDLGNFIGRISHKCSFKFGHDGLSFIFRDGNYQYGEVNVSKDTSKILRFLGFNPVTFFEGFETLEDIYRYAASSKYFNKSIFAYENRNHIARVRDEKRAAYRGFLEWLETEQNLTAYPWEDTSELGGRVEKPEFVQKAFEFFPEFVEKYNAMKAEHAVWKRSKEVFNGELVSKLTGFVGTELGGFMQHLKRNAPENFAAWVVEKPDVAEWVLSELSTFK